MKLGLVCQSEPGRDACRLLASELRHLGATVTLIAADTLRLGEAAEEPSIPLQPLAAASSELLTGLDAIGVFLEGTELVTFRQVHETAAQLRGRAPVPLFTGPIRPLCGDALAADLLPRLGYDLICLQGEAQERELAWLVRGSRDQQQRQVAIGLWCIPHQPIGHSAPVAKLLLVLDQADIPPSPFANGVLYRRLRTIAQDNPDWQVRLQPEVPLAEAADSWPDTSLAWHHHQDPAPPANLQRGHGGDLPLALIQASACLGISSSWLLTAMVWGKPTVVLGDYGIRTEFNGPLFFGCGTMHRLADCLPLDRLLELPRPNARWLAARGWAIADGPQRLLQRLRELGR
jgi:hypothetical protein